MERAQAFADASLQLSKEFGTAAKSARVANMEVISEGTVATSDKDVEMAVAEELKNSKEDTSKKESQSTPKKEDVAKTDADKNEKEETKMEIDQVPKPAVQASMNNLGFMPEGYDEDAELARAIAMSMGMPAPPVPAYVPGPSPAQMVAPRPQK